MRDILERMRRAARDCIIYEDGSEHRSRAFLRLNDAIRDYSAVQQNVNTDENQYCLYCKTVHDIRLACPEWIKAMKKKTGQR